jgi:hypothetical protein
LYRLGARRGQKCCFGPYLPRLIAFTEALERACESVQKHGIVRSVGQRELVVGASKIITTHCRVAGSNAGERVGTCRLLPLKLSERLERKTGVPERQLPARFGE